MFYIYMNIQVCVCIYIYKEVLYIYTHIYIYIYIYTLVYSPIDGHFACFHVLAIENNAAMNMGMQVSFQVSIFFSFRYSPRLYHKETITISSPYTHHCCNPHMCVLVTSLGRWNLLLGSILGQGNWLSSELGVWVGTPLAEKSWIGLLA